MLVMSMMKLSGESRQPDQSAVAIIKLEFDINNWLG
jgi:hypothetical protein